MQVLSVSALMCRSSVVFPEQLYITVLSSSQTVNGFFKLATTTCLITNIHDSLSY